MNYIYYTFITMYSTLYTFFWLHTKTIPALTSSFKLNQIALYCFFTYFFPRGEGVQIIRMVIYSISNVSHDAKVKFHGVCMSTQNLFSNSENEVFQSSFNL